MGSNPSPSANHRFDAWLVALAARHLANLTRPELTRALRALSSVYVERRSRLAAGAALDGAGKRAAFALFYAPLHFLTVGCVVRALDADAQAIETIADLGCGTGAAGAAWALALPAAPAVSAVDRNPWAVQEATWTYRQLGLNGRATVGDVASFRLRPSRQTGVILAYIVNELPPARRAALLERLVDHARKGARILVVEPIARRPVEWWPDWSDRFTAEGGRADEWRFPLALPALLRDIAKGAGLNPRELTARSLFTAQ